MTKETQLLGSLNTINIGKSYVRHDKHWRLHCVHIYTRLLEFIWYSETMEALYKDILYSSRMEIFFLLSASEDH